MSYALCRYQYFLQLKTDIVEGRVPVSSEQVIRLGAFSLQGNCWTRIRKENQGIKNAWSNIFSLAIEISLLVFLFCKTKNISVVAEFGDYEYDKQHQEYFEDNDLFPKVSEILNAVFLL